MAGSGTWWVSPEQLDDDQKNIISAKIDQNHLILGPPGSGKTNLLLLRASYLQRAGFPNILILVFTRALQEFMMLGADNYSFSPDKIQTSHFMLQKLLLQHDIRLSLDDNFEQSRLQLVNTAKTLIEKKKLHDLYEVILLDETQDYLPDEVRLFKQISRRIFSVGDIRQKIYNGDDALSIVKDMVDETHILKFHYRNGLNICKLADGIVKDLNDFTPLSETSNYNESLNPSTVEVIRCDNLKEQFDKILEKVIIQLKAYPNEFIGIICPRHYELDQLSALISQSEIAQQSFIIKQGERHQFKIDKPIIVTTIHASKGLEFRALHIAGFDYIKRFDKQRNLCYTAITRAKTSLSIYYTKGLPGFFEQANSNMNRPQNLPKIEDLF